MRFIFFFLTRYRVIYILKQLLLARRRQRTTAEPNLSASSFQFSLPASFGGAAFQHARALTLLRPIFYTVSRPICLFSAFCDRYLLPGCMHKHAFALRTALLHIHC